MRTRREFSAGGVVYRRAEDGVEIALAARRTRRGDLAWGLPKGLIEEGEGAAEAAVREVREEAGLEAEIEADLGGVSYFYVWEGARVHKVVRFFLMRATGGNVDDHDHEMEDVRWFPAAEALRASTYASERETLAGGIERLA